MNKNFEELINEIKNNDPEKKELFAISEYVSSIISKIIIERNKKGLSQRDLAKLTGLKQSAIARLESLQSIPRIDTVAKICYHLNLNLDIVSETELPITNIHYVIHYNDSHKNKHTYKSDFSSYSNTYSNYYSDKENLGCIS